MGYRTCAMVAGLLVLVLLAVIGGAGPPNTASGLIPIPTPPPLGIELIVNTTDGGSAVDGKCSLAEAITATNTNVNVDGCGGSASGGGPDGIAFNIGSGTPLINITTPLPAITAPLSIDGNTGGATRVEIRGPGGTPASGQHGFNITGSGVYIANMVINSFRDDGVFSSGPNTYLTGNIIGMDATGTTTQPNKGFGVQIQGSGAVIGGATDGGDCSGTCNLISGNTKDNVLLDTASTGAVVKGNFIGTNATGTAGAGSGHNGITAKGAGPIIGGTSGTTPGGSCTGDCNVISGHGSGIWINPGSSVQVMGNFIGTDVSGTASISNGAGIHDDGGTGIIGGTSPGARNVISGNASGIETDGGITITGNFIGTNSGGTDANGNTNGIVVQGHNGHVGGAGGTTPGGPCTGACNLISGNYHDGVDLSNGGTGADGAVVQGNFIGTNVDGTGAIGNEEGIFTQVPGVLIGGTAAGAGNVVSGNMVGINLFAGSATIQGNRIGTDSAGTAALANTGIGVSIEKAAEGNIVGGTAAGEANTIAFNGSDGVKVHGVGRVAALGSPVRGNSIHDNAGKGISNVETGNNLPSPPTITAVGSAAGTACSNCTIDVFSDSADEGRIYEGSTTAGASGQWLFIGSVTGPNVTATATNGNGDTSEFSAPFALPTPTPSPSPTHSPTPTPSPTPTATPTPTPTHSATPTATQSASRIQGDVNCDGVVDELDFEFLIEYAAGLNDGTQPDPCPDLGAALPAAAAGHPWGDVNCDDSVNALDALYVLAHTAGVELPHAGCTGIGVVLG